MIISTLVMESFANGLPVLVSSCKTQDGSAEASQLIGILSVILYPSGSTGTSIVLEAVSCPLALMTSNVLSGISRDRGEIV